jgi:hypothetical protein
MRNNLKTMNQTTLEAIKALTAYARLQAQKLNEKKRKDQQEVFNLAVLYRDIVEVENYLKTL